ncbi:MAG: T9SS type A sorting domain-containing protein [Flavobacteriales bacterium]|nr:T9SS type A sorting domain-containing protein [Flavobacteriales bacterium]
MKQLDGVQMTSLNYLMKYRAQPNDDLYATQWSMAAIDAEEVWNFTTGGSMINGKRIAVGIVDGLVQTTHPDLADNISQASTYAGEGEEHGTLVAGVVGATGNNGIGITGVNWDVDLVPLGFGGTMAGAISGFEGALSLREDFTNSAGAEGALVVAVTVSWGFLDMSCGFGYPIFEDLVTQASSRSPRHPTSRWTPTSFRTSSGCPNSNNIAVTGIGPDGDNPFAVGNSTIHLQAPGIAIPTTAIGGAYEVTDGTSFAVPHVAGAVALLYSLPCPSFAHLVMTNPQAAAQLVKNAILQGGEVVPGGNDITTTGRQLNVWGAYQILMGQCVQTCSDLTLTFTPTDGAVADAVLTGPQGNTVATASGPVLQGCLEAGCYQAVFSAAGLGPVSGTWTVTDAQASVVASGSSTDGQVAFSFGDLLPGCTTPNSGNFNPAANCNDGSCCSGDIVRVKVLAEDLVSEGTAQVNITVGGSVVYDGTVDIEFGFDPESGSEIAVGTVEVCAPDGCMTISVTDSTTPLSEEGFVTVGNDDPIPFPLATGYGGPVGDAPVQELCDGLDNDCDGLVDEDFHWFVDADGDGYGSTISLGIQCTQPPNAVADSTDCNDADPDTHFNVTLIVFTEDPNSSGTAHYVLEQGGAIVEGDMDLLQEDSGMGQQSLCVGDGCYLITITQNDVPLYLESFLRFPSPPEEEVVTAFDTEGGYQSEGPAEICDGIDNDCDGEVDEGFMWFTDADGDGFGDPSTGVVTCTPDPGAVQNSGDCDDSDPAVDHTIAIRAISATGESGLAHYVVTQGGLVTEGDILLDDQDFGIGIAEVCVGNGCFSIEIQVVDVALTDVCHVQLFPEGGFTSFFTTTGFFGSHAPLAEICDGIDNNCDGQIDEDGVCGCAPAGTPCDDGNSCTDNDTEDGACNCGGGLFTTNVCDDGDPNTINDICFNGACIGTPCADADADGFTTCQGDCDDANAAVHPGVTEVCDGIDNNCDGQIDEDNVCGCLPAGTPCDDNNPCTFNDMENGACACAGTLPTEVCDGVDNDCDGLVDEGFETYADSDGDGFGDPNIIMPCDTPGVANNLDCDDTDPAIHPGVLEVCDGLDNDCDGEVDEELGGFADNDGDGFGDPLSPLTCDTPGVSNNLDCDDTNADINPNAEEICDGIDNNCNGQIDEGGVCGCLPAGTPCDDGNSCTVNETEDGECNCGGGLFTTSVCDDGDPNTFNDICFNGNCIGTPCPDADADGFTTCQGDCDDANAAIHPGVTEVCDGIDNDCDGLVDEDAGCADEICDGIDNDGDGLIDATDPDLVLVFCENQNGVCSGAIKSADRCVNGTWEPCIPADYLLNSQAYIAGGEVCDGLDNNCDGQVDEGFGSCCNDYTLEFQSGSTTPSSVTYEVLNESGTTTVLSGNNPVPANGVGTLTLCLNDGCYQLRVTDASGNGLSGYVLRETGINGRRIIDNSANMSNGTSQIDNGGTFCVPISNTDLLYSSCDKYFWKAGEYIVCNEDAAVAADYNGGGAAGADSGYDFWFFDPNGTYSYVRQRRHNVSDNFGNVGSSRTCHAKINNWSGSQIPNGVLLNVRIRTVVNGVAGEYGPACRFTRDETLGNCPPTLLFDVPGFPQFYSCGVSRDFQNNTANRLYARPVAGATKYRFTFDNAELASPIVRVVNPYYLNLGWSAGVAPPLIAGQSYDVTVEAFKGGVYCIAGNVCIVTINNMAIGGQQNAVLDVPVSNLNLWPNPNQGDQLFMTLNIADPFINTVSMDIFDLSGKRMIARTVGIQDGVLNTTIDLNGELASGMYMVKITAGDEVFTQRVVIQK